MATLSKVDLDAMAKAIDHIRHEGGEHWQQIEGMLRERSWEQVGDFASYHCQDKALGLRPWQTPPSWLRDAAAVEAALAAPPPDLRADRVAAQLVRRLLSNGFSRYEPDPLGALSKVAAR